MAISRVLIKEGCTNEQAEKKQKEKQQQETHQIRKGTSYYCCT